MREPRNHHWIGMGAQGFEGEGAMPARRQRTRELSSIKMWATLRTACWQHSEQSVDKNQNIAGVYPAHTTHSHRTPTQKSKSVHTDRKFWNGCRADVSYTRSGASRRSAPQAERTRKHRRTQKRVLGLGDAAPRMLDESAGGSTSGLGGVPLS